MEKKAYKMTNKQLKDYYLKIRKSKDPQAGMDRKEILRQLNKRKIDRTPGKRTGYTTANAIDHNVKLKKHRDKYDGGYKKGSLFNKSRSNSSFEKYKASRWNRSIPKYK